MKFSWSEVSGKTPEVLSLRLDEDEDEIAFGLSFVKLILVSQLHR